jgi:hypothetical protein
MIKTQESPTIRGCDGSERHGRSDDGTSDGDAQEADKESCVDGNLVPVELTEVMREREDTITGDGKGHSLQETLSDWSRLLRKRLCGHTCADMKHDAVAH